MTLADNNITTKKNFAFPIVTKQVDGGISSRLTSLHLRCTTLFVSIYEDLHESCHWTLFKIFNEIRVGWERSYWCTRRKECLTVLAKWVSLQDSSVRERERVWWCLHTLLLAIVSCFPRVVSGQEGPFGRVGWYRPFYQRQSGIWHPAPHRKFSSSSNLGQIPMQIWPRALKVCQVPFDSCQL